MYLVWFNVLVLFISTTDPTNVYAFLSNLQYVYFCKCTEVIFKYVLVLQHGTPPLLIAAGGGNIQIIEVLMRKGAEIKAHDKVMQLGC